jgi:hypothetical protein
VLDGKSGKPILENPIIDTIGSQASTPLIRLEGYGNDIFLYWSSNCKGFEGNSSEFTFAKGLLAVTVSYFLIIKHSSEVSNAQHPSSDGLG